MPQPPTRIDLQRDGERVDLTTLGTPPGARPRSRSGRRIRRGHQRPGLHGLEVLETDLGETDRCEPAIAVAFLRLGVGARGAHCRRGSQRSPRHATIPPAPFSSAPTFSQRPSSSPRSADSSPVNPPENNRPWRRRTTTRDAAHADMGLGGSATLSTSPGERISTCDQAVGTCSRSGMLMHLAGYRPWQRASTTLSDDPTRSRRSSKCPLGAIRRRGRSRSGAVDLGVVMLYIVLYVSNSYTGVPH